MEQARPDRPDPTAAHLLLPCSIGSVPASRQQLARDLARWGITGDDANAILVAESEAVTNAVVHGAGAASDSVIVLRWELRGGTFRLSVQDRGPGFDSSRIAESRRAHPSQNRGRGLLLMHALMDSVTVESTRDGTRIVLEKALGGGPPAARNREPNGVA